MAALWRLVQADLRETMTAPAYACWLAPTAGVRLEGDELVVQVPSPLQQHWLDARLRARVGATLKRVGYPGVRVLFAVDP